jgi:hypothetical protein
MWNRLFVFTPKYYYHHKIAIKSVKLTFKIIRLFNGITLTLPAGLKRGCDLAGWSLD